jgi:hypothetical protein
MIKTGMEGAEDNMQLLHSRLDFSEDFSLYNENT